MTAENYLRGKYMRMERMRIDGIRRNNEYVGKHEPRIYDVWRVLGPAGPQESLYVIGLDAAKEAVYGAWDYEIRDMNGEMMKC